MATASHALDTARAGAYDLVILDLMLPGLHGTELLKRLRHVNKEVPVLVLTARDAVADKIANFEAGADDYLTKPFAFAELAVRVKALLRRGPVTRANVLRIADLEIDRLSHQVRRNGDSIKLTAKEYSLVEYLALNTRPGGVAVDDRRARLGSEFRGIDEHRGRVCAPTARQAR